MDAVRAAIRDVPDFPKPGIVFKDITPVLSDAKLFRHVIDTLAAHWKDARISKVIGIESRGFLFAAPLAYALGAGLTIARKPGKLPWNVIRETYALEYGENSLELHVDAVGPGERVLIVDDVLATGGTADAVGRLVARQGAEVVAFSFLVELSFLHGARKIGPNRVHALLTY
ncbi:MAG: adenine phosphoribosyltransferase [Anaeromyxobacteraceae bacterium]